MSIAEARILSCEPVESASEIITGLFLFYWMIGGHFEELLGAYFEEAELK